MLAIATVLQLPQAIPCNGSRTTTPTCGKTVVLTKVGPDGPVVAAGAAGFFTYPVNVFARGSNFLPAPNCPQPTSVEVEVILHCDPGPDANGSSGAVAIGPGFNDVNVIVTVPNGPPRECTVSAIATVTFSDGSVVTSVCPESDTGPTVCIVAPIAPGTPRLDIERRTPPVIAVHAGDLGLHRYRIKNNDPSERFSGRLCIGSKNTSKIPEDTSGTGNVFGISDPSGDAFGVYFADEIPAGVCPPLPKFPHRQRFREIKRTISLAPGQEIFVEVLHRPYGGCATGSCNESRVRLRGNFTDNTTGLACTNAAVVVDNQAPRQLPFQCPGIGSVGQVVGVDQALKIADFQILVAPQVVFGSHLPVRMQGGVAGFPGLQVQTVLRQEDNNESVRDTSTISDPGGNVFPPGVVLDGVLFAQFEDPSGNNELNLARMELVEGAPTGLSHLAPVVKAILEGFPLGPVQTPETLTEVMLQYGALGTPQGGTGNPIPLPLEVVPDGFGGVEVRITIPDAGAPIVSVDLVCDVRMYGAERVFNPPLDFQGNLVAPLGQAGLNIDHSRDHLTISNIGSSGLDGVSIDLDENLGGADVQFAAPLLLGQPGLNFGLQGQGIIQTGTGPPQVVPVPLGNVQIDNPGGNQPILVGDFNPFGAQNMIVQVFGNGRLAGSVILPSAGQICTLDPLSPNFGLPGLRGCGKFEPGFPYSLPCFFWDFDRLGAFNFPDGRVLVGDRVAMFASGSPDQLVRVTDLALQGARLVGGTLTVSNIGSSGQDGIVAPTDSVADQLRRDFLEKTAPEIPDFDVELFGHPHLALGQARLNPRGDHLTISNIGSSGCDGVSIDLGDEDTFEALLLPAVNLRMPGTAFQVSGTGTVGGIPGRGLGFFGCQNNGGIVQAVADFKALGIPNVVIEVLLGGVPQGTFTVACGVIGTVTPGPGGGFPQINRVGKLAPTPTPCFYIGTDRPVRFAVAGGPTVVADEVRALADGLPEPLTGIQQISLLGTNLGTLGIGGETQADRPIITGVVPNAGTTGEVVTISGSGFDPDPDNNCAVVMSVGNPIAIPLVVLSSTGTEMRARIGPMPPDLGNFDGQLMVATGNGKKGFFEPAFPEIVVEQPVWVWGFTGQEVPDGPRFTPIPTPPPPTTVWFEQPVVNQQGELCLSFEDPDNPGQPYAWPDPCKIEINARLRDHTDFFGYDQFAACLRFEGLTDPVRCAEAICDSVRCAFFQQAGIVVSCRVEVDQATGIPTVYLGFADGVHQVDWGTFSVCVTALQPEPVITDVTPNTGTTGDVVRITGSGFGNCPDDLCVIVMSGDRSIGLEVLAARDDLIIARLTAVPPNVLLPGQIMVARGKGRRGFFQPIFPDIVIEEPVWIWDFLGGETLQGFPFTPVHTPPAPNDMWFFSPDPINGEMCLTIKRFDWDPGCKLTISARMRDHASGRGHDHYSACIRFPQAGSFEDCMERICDTIRCSWAQMGGIPVTCRVDFTATDGTICLGFPPPFQVDWGNLDICIDCPDIPPPPPEILFFDRASPTTGDVVRIAGLNLCTNGIDTSCLVGWWPLDWDACDFSGNCHHGQVIGTGVNFGKPGASSATGRAAEFNGTGHIDVPWAAALNTQSFTLSLWAKADAAGGGSFRSPVTNRDDVAPAGAFRHGWILYNNNVGNWSFWNGGGPGGAGGWNVADVGPVAVGPWQHVAISYDKPTNTKRIFIDGVLVSTTNPVAFSPNNGNLLDGLPHENENLHIGGGGDTGTNFRWDGCIDDVSLWNKALSQTQLDAIRRNSLPRAADFCLLAMDGTRANTFNVDDQFQVGFDPATGVDVMTATLGPPRPDAQRGPLMIDKGDGTIRQPIPIFDDITFGKKHWAWRNDPDIPGGQGPDIEPVPSTPEPGEKWYYSEPPANGVMCIYIDGFWGVGSMVTISGRMRDHSTGKGYDQFSSGITIDAPMSPLGCAERICDAITCTWSQLAGVRVLCIAEPFGNDGAKITLLFENGSIDWGSISICATDVGQRETFDEWKARFGIIDDLDDGDFDGLPAILEAYLGLNPTIGDVFDNTFDQSGMIMFQKDPRITGLAVFVETSKNLIDYQTVAVNPPADPSGKVTVFHSPLGLRGFWRLRVKRW